MKVLTIKQPWASLIMSGIKEYEFRSWKTRFRGTLLIHAGKSIDQDAMKRLGSSVLDKLEKPMPLGKILGSVEVTDCIAIDEMMSKKLKSHSSKVYSGIEEYGQYAIKMSNPKVFDKYIEINGKLGLWNFDK